MTHRVFHPSVFGRAAAAGLLCLGVLGAAAARAAAPTAAEVVKKVQARAGALKSYTLEWSYDGRDKKTGKTKPTEKYTLDFLSPNLRKMTILQKDVFSNGAVVIYNPAEDKQVVAKKFPLTRKYDVGSPDIDGYFDTDLASIAKKIGAAFAGSTGAASKESALGGKKVWIVSFRPKKEHTLVNLWVDAATSVVSKLEFFDAKGLTDRRTFTKFAPMSFKPDHFKH